MPKAVVLLSGGLDSTTVLAIAQNQGFEVCALTFRYGQRHSDEVAAALRIAGRFGVQRHEIVEVPLRQFGGSALTDQIEVPKDRDEAAMAGDIPITYVPARNTVFLSLALALAESIGAHDIFLGVSAVDYSGYPDCRPEYIEAFQAMARLATKAGIEGEQITIHAPLVDLSKAETIRIGLDLGVDYGLTHSCYDPIDGRACGRCDSCLIRSRAFEAMGLKDPALFETWAP